MGLSWDRRTDRGPFDLVGDIHGCLVELDDLLLRLGYGLDGVHPEGRTLVFVGDLVDRGPDSVGVLRRVIPMLESGHALLCPGNHDDKFCRWLRGNPVKINGGLETTTSEWKNLPEEEARTLGDRVGSSIGSLAPYLWLDEGRLLVAHAGLEERDHGREGQRIRAFCLYGKVTGRVIDGYPERVDWAADYRGETAVVYGHTPVREALWVNNTANIDLGCVYGGGLAALQWPERSFVVVPASRSWWPTGPAAREPSEPSGLSRSSRPTSTS